MCNAWIRRLLKWDRKKQFHFAPLDSDTAKRLLAPVFPDYVKEDTVIYYNEGKIFLRSSAVIEISKELPLPYNLLPALKMVPEKWLNALYDRIAGNRYQYGERFEACPLPPSEWWERFLD